MKLHRPSSGFTLIEIVIALALFVLITTSIYLVSENILSAISRNQSRSALVGLIEREIETVRGMDYDDIGIIGGVPDGLIEASRVLTINNLEVRLDATIRAIDDPFDGTIGGTPNDIAPADYKLVEFTASCLNCSSRINSVTMTTTAAPRNLENATDNGALFINVFDSSGVPVQGADVHVENNVLTPTINIDDETDGGGVLQLVDIPTSTQAYEISVSKGGYSSSQTYPLGDPSNPNPIKQHATVITQEVTSVSFAIDKVSTLSFDATDEFCNGVASVDFNLQGAKLIGTAPDVYKYSVGHTTNSLGSRVVNGLEWDLYSAADIDSIYDVAGSFPVDPITLAPDSTGNIHWFVEAANPSSLRVVVEDSSGALIDDASIRLQGSGYDETFYSGKKEFTETNWSAGQYSSKDSAIETDASPGTITLAQFSGLYPTSTVYTLTSETIDFGTSVTSFKNMYWNPTSQPPGAGSNSMRIQVATNNDNSTWNFVGPDGTSGSYFETSGTALHISHDNNRYMRYRLYMQTASDSETPRFEDIEIEFFSSCVTAGQSLLSGLSTGTYTITVDKPGYSTYTDSSVSVLGDYQTYRVVLTP